MAAAVIGLAVAPLAMAAPVASASDNVGWIRLAHLSPNAPAVDVYLYSFGNPAAVDVLHHVAYGTVSGYLQVAAGDYTVAMRGAGAAPRSKPVLSTAVDIKAGHAYTVAGMGPAAGLRLQVFPDRLTAPPGKALVRVIQASMQQDTVTVTAGKRTLARNLKFASVTSFRGSQAGLRAAAGGGRKRDGDRINEPDARRYLHDCRAGRARQAVHSLPNGCARQPGGSDRCGDRPGWDCSPSRRTAAAVGRSSRSWPGRGADRHRQVESAAQARFACPLITRPSPGADALPPAGMRRAPGSCAGRGPRSPRSAVPLCFAAPWPGSPGPRTLHGRLRLPAMARWYRCRRVSGLRRQPPSPGRVARPTALDIPAIGVRTRLVRLGLTASGALQVPASAAVAGWYTGSPRPGAIGSAIIAGHIDSYRGPGVFFRLRDAQARQPDLRAARGR